MKIPSRWPDAEYIVVNMCEKFHNDRLRNDRSSGNGKSDNNDKKATTFVAIWDPFSGLKTAAGESDILRSDHK